MKIQMTVRCIKSESYIQTIDSKASHKVKHICNLNQNTKIAKELALLQSHKATTVNLETKYKALVPTTAWYNSGVAGFESSNKLINFGVW
jgi:hypothetical protein